MALSVSTTNLVDLGAVGLTGYPFTFASWFRVPNVPYAMSLVYVSNATYTSFHSLYYEGHAQQQAMLVSKNVATGVARTTVAMIPGKWHHVAGVFESSTLRKVYLDGHNVGADTTSVNFDTASHFILGSIAYPDVIDVAEFTIVGSALSEAEIQSLAGGMTPLSLAGIGSILAYHNCVSQLNQPGWGPTASSPSQLPATDHPAIFHTRGGYAGYLRRYPGPYCVGQGETHGSGSVVSQPSTSAAARLPGVDCPAGAVLTGIAQRGEVLADAEC